MQAESEIVMNLPEDEGDDLFGSPPPSPAAALPFSDPLVGLSRPPAPLPTSACGYGQLDISRPVSRSSRSTPSSSRASSMAPSNAKQKKRKAKSVLSRQSSRPPTTEIPLPDPSAPLPANWLRSQSALLGHAGLVGGVKAAHLSRNRGSTLSNPIIVHDPEEKRATQKSQSLRPVIAYSTLEGLNLPAPSTQDIVDILIKQKEVFPILQDILKLYSREAALHGPHVWGNQNDLPAPKRRRLDVPAGADDWDVPFPFQHGEGPQKYRAEWVQERAKHLVAQLVALIKTASRKAALRNYLNQENGIREQLEKSRQEANDLPSIKKELEHSLPKTNGHYKPTTALYGTNMSNLPANTAHPSTTLTPTALAQGFSLADQSSNPPSSTVDQVITSLLNNQNTAQDRSDQSSLHESDDWLSFLEALQTSEKPSETPPNTAQAASPETPTTIDGDLSMDLPWLPEHSNSSFNPSPIDSPSFPSPGVDTTGVSTNTDTYYSSHDLSIGFDMGDMALPSIEELFGFQPEPYPDHLSISIPQTSGPPSLVASPMPSMSSMGDFPMTPTSSVAFDFNDITMGPGDVPDDVMNAVSSLMALGDGKGSGGESVSGKQLEIPATRLNSEVVHDEVEIVGGSGGGQQQQGQQRPELSDSDAVEVNKVLPLLMTSIGTSSIGTSSIFTPNVPKTYQPSTTPVDRAEILRRAREMRKQLADEIVKTRTQLWETTIEHGVLTHMGKYYK